MLLIANIYGDWINNETYDIPSIKVNDNLYLFIIHDDKYTKFIAIDNNLKWIEGKYIEGYLDLENKNELINMFNSKNCNIVINQQYYNITKIRLVENFVPKNSLNEYILFTIWFGNHFSSNRKNGLFSIQNMSNCNVINVNKNNLHYFIKPEYPLHEGFKYLSDIHKSDYLRCYLMHHYGGGYSDIKKTSGSWHHLFDRLKNNNSLMAIGYKVDGIAFPEENNEELNKKLEDNFNNMMGVGFFIFKPYTELTMKWYNNMNERMDYYFDQLKKNPAKFSRESKDGTPVPWWEGGSKNTLYPISWNRILGQILYPLQLEYLKNIEKGIPDRADNNNYL